MGIIKSGSIGSAIGFAKNSIAVNTPSKKTFTSYSPMKVGWYLWEG
ncbi:hypothetical protein [Streptomyces sp. AC154]